MCHGDESPPEGEIQDPFLAESKGWSDPCDLEEAVRQVITAVTPVVAMKSPLLCKKCNNHFGPIHKAGMAPVTLE